jgi:hypothetical protein
MRIIGRLFTEEIWATLVVYLQKKQSCMDGCVMLCVWLWYGLHNWLDMIQTIMHYRIKRTFMLSLRFKLEVFIWRHVVNVPTSSTTFRGILICVIFRPGICKNIFLCSVLHWRIIRIKRFFSGKRCLQGRHLNYTCALL